MKFLIQVDSRYKSKAYVDKWYQGLGFTKINCALAQVRKATLPQRICYQTKSQTRTLFLFKGIGDDYTTGKKRNLIQIGPMFFVPKIMVRKTTRKRNAKT